VATGWTVRGSNPGGGEIFRTCPDRPWGTPSLLYNGYPVFPGSKERPERDAEHSPLLVPWSRKSRAIPLLPYGPYGLYRASVPVQYSYTSTSLWTVWPVQSLSACTRVTFTFTFFCCPGGRLVFVPIEIPRPVHELSV